MCLAPCAVIDTILKLDKYINNTCKFVYSHLKNRGLRRCLSEGDAEICIHAFITNKVDYCNYLLYGIPDNMIKHLQNITARILTRNSKQCHITLF